MWFAHCAFVFFFVPTMSIHQRTIPFLPGNSFRDVTKTRYHKSQALQFTMGGAVRVVDDAKPAIGGVPTAASIAASQSTLGSSASFLATASGAGGAPSSSSSSSSSTPVPAWVAFDRQVLCFTGFYMEGVTESRFETYRVRAVKVYYYLADDTMQVVEPSVGDSGLPSGNLIRRHRIPVEGGGEDEYVGIGDLNVGKEVVLYAKRFRLTGADGFTRTFLAKLGVDVPADEPVPDDPYASHRASVKAGSHSVVGGSAALGTSIDGSAKPADSLRQFLENDRKVLRFFCVWDDSVSMYGDERLMILNYYLASDKVEVREQIPQNSGRDPVPQFMKASALPKVPLGLPPVGSARQEHSPALYYSPADFRVGEVINVYGRPMKIYDMDSFTRSWYKDNFGLTQNDLAPLPPPNSGRTGVVIKREIPPPTGFGSEEDSLACMHSLIPRAPKRDLAKMRENEGKALRFAAQFVDPSRIDRDRRFVVSYHLAHDTVSVFEPPVRNSGRLGGKFIDRQPAKKADGSTYSPQDFYVGAVISVRSFRFLLTDADEFALSYMEQRPEQFPRSSLPAVIDHVIADLVANAVPPETVIQSLSSASSSSSSSLDPGAFQSALSSLGIALSGQELLTLMRSFDVDGNARIAYPLFLDAIGIGGEEPQSQQQQQQQ